MEYFARRRGEIAAFLDEYLTARVASRDDLVAPWGKDLAMRLAAFCRGGKMMRGALVFLGRDLYAGGVADDEAAAAPRGDDEAAALRCAAAMELFQAGLLVHDDIMDRDRERRGKPSVFWQYATLAEGKGAIDAYHAGEALGTCAGDFAFFLAFELVASAVAEAGHAALLPLCARELAVVSVGQMRDLGFAAFPEFPPEGEIIELYVNKTGRYSFSLPLVAGALIAGKREADCQDLARAGELMGLVFQLRDDELGLFGEAPELGKPVGGDLREGKKTLYAREFFDRADGIARKWAEGVFGKPEATDEDIARLAALVESAGARSAVNARAADWSREAQALIDSLDGNASATKSLLSLLSWSSARIA